MLNLLIDEACGYAARCEEVMFCIPSNKIQFPAAIITSPVTRQMKQKQVFSRGFLEEGFNSLL